MKEKGPENSARLRVWSWLIVAGAGAAALLFFFNPASHGFYPRCLFHSVTGLDCPGCGGLRALHALLHGDVAGAFRLNPLLVTLLPCLTAWLAGWLWQNRTGRERAGFDWMLRPFWLWLLLAVIVLFGVARNLPFGPLVRIGL